MPSLIIIFCALLAFQRTFAVEPATLVSHKPLSVFTPETLKAHFKSLGIPKMFFPVRRGVVVYDIAYTTTYADGSVVKATGMVFSPMGENLEVPLKIYNQGTQLCRERELSYRGEQAVCLAYASDGYLVLMPDYVGMGGGEREHLYIHAQTEADATVDMLKVVADSLHLFEVKSFGKIFISGYSQGGHAALATHQKLQNEYATRFPVTACAPMSGPYDIFFSVYDSRNKRYEQPGYMPYLLKGFYESSGKPEAIKEVFVSPFDTIIPRLLTGEYPMRELNKHLPDTSFLSVKRDYYEEFETDPNHPFRKYLIENNVHDWKPESPVLLCYCDGDEQVSYLNSVRAYQAMKRNGAQQVKLWRAGKKFRHVSCALFSMVYVKMYFDAFVRNKPGSHGPHFKRLLLNVGKLAVKP